MNCVVFILAVLTGVRVAVAAASSCSLSEDFFLRHNISADDSDGPGEECGGSCCGRAREARLRGALQRATESRAAQATRPIADLLLTTRRTLQEHLTALSHQSQNKTATLFAQVYRGHATRAHAPLAALYADIRLLLRPSADRGLVSGEDLGSPPPRDLTVTTRKFFRDLFPLAYHNVLRLDTKQFTPEYEVCLKDAYDAAQPFGDVPYQLGTKLSRSLEAARALLQALVVGAGALASSEQLLSKTDDNCSTKLLRVGGCARCRGLVAKPCRHYCLNVARGCSGSLVAELEAPWAGYVEAVERLARGDADAALRTLDARVSQAIMHAFENQILLEKKVVQECGTPSTTESYGPQQGRAVIGGTRRDALRAPPPDTELLQFAASLSASKRLFAGLADHLCDEPDFAHDDNEHCWNGNGVGEYTKPLVASSSLSDQKYNPEIEGSAPQDPRVAAVGDILRQVRQLVVSNEWGGGGGIPTAEAYMQGDEAEVESSGSDDDAAFDDSEGSGEEGSGRSDDMGTRIFAGEGSMDTSTPKTSAASMSRALGAVMAAAILALAGRSLA